MAAVRCNVPYPADDLQKTSDKTLWAQHHDAWITATTLSGRHAWAFQVAAETWDAEAICAAVIDHSLDKLTASSSTARATGNKRSVHVVNTLAHDRRDLVEIELATSMGTKSVRVLDSSGKVVPSQFEIARKYVQDKSIGAVRLLFRDAVPALGQAVYAVEDSPDDIHASQSREARAAVAANGAVTIETDLYRMRLDPSRGGVIASLFAKPLNKEFCESGERGFHEFRGYFIGENAWQSSTDHPASVKVIENGPVRVTVAVSGRISSVRSFPHDDQSDARTAPHRFSYPIPVRKRYVDQRSVGNQTF
ncbi:MAG TPA: hypothetical protein VN633_03015 [Bryobacteraceae bacterium]|nr:hypothetical protein [Bryobacteraceae bacterium]